MTNVELGQCRVVQSLHVGTTTVQFNVGYTLGGAVSKFAFAGMFYMLANAWSERMTNGHGVLSTFNERSADIPILSFTILSYNGDEWNIHYRE